MRTSNRYIVTFETFRTLLDCSNKKEVKDYCKENYDEKIISIEKLELERGECE